MSHVYIPALGLLNSTGHPQRGPHVASEDGTRPKEGATSWTT